MCGIAGYYVALSGVPDRQMVETISADQRQRGPDHSAVSESRGSNATVVMGHNRLSIIDLTDAANQPMPDTTDSLRIVFNGEIYNYVEIRKELRSLGHAFRTESDTEVIIEAFRRWGADAFPRLNGMFAFALFDRRDGRLWLVRDRFGVKPLYYAFNGDSLVFASTPGPIARALGRKPNLEYASRGLHYWIYEDDSSISPYLDVHAVQAGTYVVVSAEASGPPRVDAYRWYDFSRRVAALREELPSASDRDLVAQFEALLQHAVSLRLRADVPIGVSLSGGLDSASIAAVMSGLGAETRAFSFSDPHDAATEGPLVERTTRELDIPVTYTALDDRGRVKAFWKTLDAQGAPFPAMSIVAQYAVFMAAHRAGMKVLLGGQGADEALMGYRKFQLILLRQAVRVGDIRQVLGLAAGMSLMLRAEAGRASTYVRQRNRYLRRGGLKTALRLPPPEAVNLFGSRQAARQRQIDDLSVISLPTLLRYEDRNSMANSLETRLPYLDYRVAEFAVALPDALKVRRGYGKWILREAMAGRIPKDIRLARYKRGFDAPPRVWISAGLGSSIRNRLRELRPDTNEFLPAGETTDGLFSDDRLIRHPTAFAEATTLLWLGQSR